MSARKAILVINATRPEAVQAATTLAALLGKSSFELFTSSAVKISGVETVKTEELPDAEIVIVLGGDGTILRGAEISRLRKIPLLGVNLGHVGFMAEVEKLSLEAVAASVLSKSYTTDSRMVLAYSVERDGKTVSSGWSLNEVTIERTESTMVELLVQVDRRPLSRWGCDGLIAATPPFWLKIEITRALPCSEIAAGVANVVTALPVRLAVVTTSSSFVDIALKRETSFYPTVTLRVCSVYRQVDLEKQVRCARGYFDRNG